MKKDKTKKRRQTIDRQGLKGVAGKIPKVHSAKTVGVGSLARPKNSKLQKTPKHAGGRPRRSDKELALEGKVRAGKKIRTTRSYPPLQIPNFKNESGSVIYFFKNYLPHTMGQWEGRPFDPLPWEADLIRKIFDTKDSDGKRKIRKALLLIARKNGKTVFSAGLLLYWLLVKSENNRNLRIYSAATTKEQASLIFDAASQMVEGSKELCKRIKIVQRYKRLVNHRTGAKYEALSSDVKGHYGFFNAELVVFDEMWEQRDVKFISALHKSQVNLKEPLFLAISTNGTDKESPLFDDYYYGKQIEKGVFEDDSFYFKCYELEEDDDWTLEENWYKANPSLSAGILNIEELRSACKRALRIPREESEFKQFHCNLWVSQATAWINIGEWEKCYDPQFHLRDFKGKPCYMGIDLSETRDTTSVVLLFPVGPDFYLAPFFFLPKANLDDKAKTEKVPYDIWARQGHLILTEGNVVDYDVVLENILGLAGLCDILQVAIDPYNSKQVKIKLEEKGLNIIDIRQGFLTMNAPVKELERLILSRRIHHDGNPIMRWMLDNCTLLRDSTGSVKIDKRKRNSKVDGVSATLDALALILDKKPDNIFHYVQGSISKI